MNNLIPAANAVVNSMADKQRALLRRSDAIITRGSYDHAEQIFEAIGEHEDLTFRVINESTLSNKFVDTSQTLIINCPGRGVETKGIDRIHSFVEAGGWLVTTDWALSVVEKAFPGYIHRASGRTMDDVVNIRLPSPDHPIVKGVIDNSEFWLERGSHLIEIDERCEHAVHPLIKSAELKEKYGQTDLVMVGFQYGRGKVFHSTSHFELQRSKAGGTRYEDSYSSVKLLTNILTQKAAANIKGQRKNGAP